MSFPPLNGIWRPGGLAAWKANRALRYIEGNLGSTAGIRERADCLALRESRFSPAFKQSLGSSPCAYVAARRVERAKLMMTSTRERLVHVSPASACTAHPPFN